MGPALGKFDHYIHQFVSSINLLKKLKKIFIYVKEECLKNGVILLIEISVCLGLCVVGTIKYIQKIQGT